MLNKIKTTDGSNAVNPLIESGFTENIIIEDSKVIDAALAVMKQLADESEFKKFWQLIFGQWHRSVSDYIDNCSADKIAEIMADCYNARRHLAIADFVVNSLIEGNFSPKSKTEQVVDIFDDITMKLSAINSRLEDADLSFEAAEEHGEEFSQEQKEKVNEKIEEIKDYFNLIEDTVSQLKEDYGLSS